MPELSAVELSKMGVLRHAVGRLKTSWASFLSGSLGLLVVAILIQLVARL
jgi:hypothetical protein